MTRARLVIGLWLLALSLAAAVAATARVGSSAAVFLPDGATAEQRLILDKLRHGTASRVLLIAVADPDGGPAAAALRDRLARTGLFSLVATRPNPGLLTQGSTILFRYRYLLSRRIDADTFTADNLRRAFDALVTRLRQGRVIDERLAAADPTGAMRQVLRQFLGGGGQGDRGRWRTAKGYPVILAVVEGAAYNLDRQARIIARVRHAAAALESSPPIRISGAPAIALATRHAIQNAAVRVSLWASAAVLIIIGLALRSIPRIGLCLLPVASGWLIGVATVVAVFGQIHGITLAFASTLLGVTSDYPMHLLWRARGEPVARTARGIGRALFIGIASTAIGFAALGFSGFEGLQQVALVTTVGIVTAGAVTYWVLPALVAGQTPAAAPPARGRTMGAQATGTGTRAGGWSRLAGHGLALALIGAGAWAAITDVALETDLASLSPVPDAVIARDRALREAVGASASRYAVRVTAADREQALRRTEAVVRVLANAHRRGQLDRYRAVTAVIPSARTQRQRQQALPAPDRLRAVVDQATAGLPLQPGAFEPFIADVAASRGLPPLTPDDLPPGFLRQWVNGHLFEYAGHWVSIVSLAGVRDAAGLRARLTGLEGASLLDRADALDAMVTHYQIQAVRHFALGSLLIALTLVVTMPRPRRVAQVGLTVAGAVGGTLAVLALAGGTVSLFHVIGLLLVVGLAIDYGVFAGDQGRTGRDSVTICAATTTSAFAIIATADIPVLRDIGLTVATGTALAWVLAWLMSGSAAARKV